MDRNHGAAEPSIIGKTPASWSATGVKIRVKNAGSRRLHQAGSRSHGVHDKVHCDMAGIVV
jgi:hypothetical protein